jgi:hypothetical protein
VVGLQAKLGFVFVREISGRHRLDGIDLLLQLDLGMEDSVLQTRELQQDVVTEFVFETKRFEPIEGAQQLECIGRQLSLEPGPADLAVGLHTVLPFDPRSLLTGRIRCDERVVVVVDTNDRVGLAEFVAAAGAGDFNALLGLWTGHGFALVVWVCLACGLTDRAVGA